VTEGPVLDIQIPYSPWRDSDKQVGQWYVHQSRARFRLLMKGRQSGGTQCGVAEICIDAMAYPGHVNWWVVNNLETKARAWNGLVDFLPKAVVAKTNQNERLIRLVNGSEIWVKSAAGDNSLVAASLDFVVCDECGLWPEDSWERGVSPMLLARPNSQVVLIGTPRGRSWFYRMWLKGRPGEQKEPDYESFHWKSEDSPFSDLGYLAERRKNMPVDLYKEEFEADPINSSGGVFKNVREAVIIGLAEADRFTCIGVDLARKGDFTAIIPMNTKRRALWVERSQEDWPIQKARLARLSMELGFARLVVDSANVGDVIVQDMRAAGVAVEDIPTNSAERKRDLIDNLRVAFQNGTVLIPNDPVLIDELEAYTYEVLPKSGTLRYFGPEGKHDDTVIALALALWGQRGALARPAGRGGPQSYLGRQRGESYMNRKSA
jgi:hypothetical protein